MIDEVSVRNFKRFQELTLRLGGLTVLTGLNGTGKSTSIQAVLLGRELADDSASTAVPLNGPYGLALGDALDVLNFEAADNEVGLRFVVDGRPYEYLLEAAEARQPYLRVLERPGEDPRQLRATGPGFVYLMAERLGPRDLLSVTSVEAGRLGVGEQGQFTAQVLAEHETRGIRDALLHPATPELGVRTLRTQGEQWASDIISPIQITAQWPPGLHTSVLRFQKPGIMSDPIRPANIGFGFSYTLPIIVAGLLAPEGGLLLVENPEAHLHPGGQSRLGRFLARVAGAGVQVVVETHSDHILNGVRLAIAEERTIRPDDVAVHFFGGEGESGPVTIDVNDRGRLSSWPDGFFDQIESDLGRLSRARRDQQ